MGYGFRIFLISDDNSIKQIPAAKFERLWNSDSDEQWKVYAKKRLRYAKVVLELKSRKPSSILHVDYGYLVFDLNGKLDQGYLDDALRLAVEIIPPLSNDMKSSNIIHSESVFAKRKYINCHTWEPDAAMEKTIYDLAIGENRT